MWCVAIGGVVVTSGIASAQTPEPKDPNDRNAPPTPTEPTPTTPPVVMPEEQPDQEQTTTVVVPPPAPTPEPVVVDTRSELERIGMSVSAGGGVAGFTGDSLRDATNDGGAWTVRAAIGTKSPVAFEGSYLGSAQGIDAFGLDNDAVLVGNGLQGALSLNITMDDPVQPFLYGGLAWTHYDITNADVNLSDLQDNDDVLEIPLGIGIGGRYEGLAFDLRGEFRIASEEDLVPSFTVGEGSGAEDMHRYGVNATVGYEF